MAHNPYAPPQAQDLQAPAPRAVEIAYAGFWRRLGCHCIDSLILSPVALITTTLAVQSLFTLLYVFVPGGLLLRLFFNIYLVQRFGGTPGRLLLRTRITLVDGSPVTFKAAALRFSVTFVLSTAVAVSMLLSFATITEEPFFPIDAFERQRKITERFDILLQVWILSEFITMYFNKKRQALPDLMAGTVVVRVT